MTWDVAIVFRDTTVPVAAECCTCLPVCHFRVFRGGPLSPLHTPLPLPLPLPPPPLPPPASVGRGGESSGGGGGAAGGKKGGEREGGLSRLCSFGHSVNLPLGSRSADPHSTAVWCGNLLHSSPRSHTVVCVGCTFLATLHPMEYSLLQPRSAPEDAPAGIASNRSRNLQSPLYTTMLCLKCPSATAMVVCKGIMLH